MTQDMSQIFRPLIARIPGQPDPTSGDYADLRAARPSYATHGLPDPMVTGPCQSRASILCTHVGTQRMDPMDQAETETAFRGYTQMCDPCYDAQADEYIRITHGR